MKRILIARIFGPCAGASAPLSSLLFPAAPEQLRAPGRACGPAVRGAVLAILAVLGLAAQPGLAADRKPLVIDAGQVKQMPTGDTVPVASGGTGAGTSRDAAGNIGAPWIVAQSAVQSSHTGDTNETTLASFTVPAGALGPNGQLEVISLWSATSSANNKTIRLDFGGTDFLQVNLTTNGQYQVYTRIANRNSASSQIGHVPNVAGFGVSGGALASSSVDTTSPVTVSLTGQPTNAADTIALESYIARLSRGD
jgi:hypothetical protein